MSNKPIKLFNSTEESNPYCIVCKPGFKPVTVVVGLNEHKLITNCNKILNCSELLGYTTFNKCTKCLEGFALNMTDDECLPFENKLCYKGFYKTIDE